MDSGLLKAGFPNSQEFWRTRARRGWATPGARGGLLRWGWQDREDSGLGSRRRRGFLFGLLRLVAVEPALQQEDGVAEAVALGEQQVDVVEVLLATEAVGEVVTRVDRGKHLAAAGAQKAEVTLAHLRRRARAAQGGDGHRHAGH